MKDLSEPHDLADFSTLPEKGKPSRAPRVWLVAHGVAWGINLIVLAFFIPKFEALFVDFGIDLPWYTVLVIKASHLRMLLVPSLLVLLGVDWSVLRALDRPGEAGGRRTWSIAMLVAPLLLFAATIVALFLPLSRILTRLSG